MRNTLAIMSLRGDKFPRILADVRHFDGLQYVLRLSVVHYT